MTLEKLQIMDPVSSGSGNFRSSRTGRIFLLHDTHLKQLVIIAILDTSLSTYTNIDLYYIRYAYIYILIHKLKKNRPPEKKLFRQHKKKTQLANLGRPQIPRLGCHFCPAFVGARVHSLSKNTIIVGESRVATFPNKKLEKCWLILVGYQFINRFGEKTRSFRQILTTI